jgi:hypothetical protein
MFTVGLVPSPATVVGSFGLFRPGVTDMAVRFFGMTEMVDFGAGCTACVAARFMVICRWAFLVFGPAVLLTF